MLVICVKCRNAMSLIRMGRDVISDDETVIRRGDHYSCEQEDCGTEIITDFGAPMQEHNLAPGQFERTIANAKARGDLMASW